MKKWQWWLIVAVVIAGGGKMAYDMTRGLRNKNPGNIRHNAANKWKGQSGVDDKGFVIFSDYSHGVRAIGKILDSYKRRGVLTIKQIISEWAPNSENDTNAYLSSVLKYTGQRADLIPVREEGDYTPLVMAIIKHENGVNPFSRNDVAKWLAMA